MAIYRTPERLEIKPPLAQKSVFAIIKAKPTTQLDFKQARAFHNFST